jgi:hypothetical protein
MKRLAPLLLALAAGLLLVSSCTPPPGPPAPRPTPLAPSPAPQPKPKPRPCPGPGPCPRSAESASIGGPVAPDGTEVQCDLPNDLHVRNRGGSDGAGLCVFASLRHAGLWQNEPVFAGLFEWMFRQPGGGYPEKVDRMIEQFCQERSLPRPEYVQLEGDDLGPLKLACSRGLMPGVTYSYSPTGRYGGRRISHMVSLVHADEHWFAVLDNNYPGTIEWMDPETFQRVYTGGRSGWAVILLRDGPPPPPRNSE